MSQEEATPPAPPAPPTGTAAETARPGLPWEREDPGKSPAGALQTLRLVLFAPVEAFTTMRRRGGVGDPLLFLVLFGTIGAFFGLLWQSTTRTFFGSFEGVDVGQIALTNAFGLVWLLAAPFLVVLFAAVRALLYHACLLLFGGAPQPFETTFRVVAYASGAASLWAVLPFCGGIVGFLYDMVITVIGLAQAHDVPGGRAVAAVVVPFLLFCFCCALVWLMVIGTALSLGGLVNG